MSTSARRKIATRLRRVAAEFEAIAAELAAQDTAGDIKDRRLRAGLTQAALAALLGVDAMTVSRWERGLAQPDAATLDALARAGIAEIAEAVPDAVGESIVRRVRAEVWGREIAGHEHIPAGAGFAALSLGFLGDDAVKVYETGPWTRLTTARGHVLVKRRAWTLSR